MSVELIAGLGGAVLGAVVAGVFAWLLHRSERLASDKADLRRALSKLIDYQDEVLLRVGSIKDESERAAAGRSLATKRMIEIENAAALAKRIGDDITTAECVTLATEYSRDADFATAEKYYKRGVAVAQTKVAKVYALRSLAISYFVSTPLQSFEKGRKYFTEAVGVLAEPRDDYSKYNHGYTFEVWAIQEMSSGFRSAALEKFDSARKYYENMAADYSLREPALNSLAAGRRALEQSGTVPTPPAAKSDVQVEHLMQEGQKAAQSQRP
jgi:hypothetical protein